MQALIGRKVGMTHIYAGERGKLLPVTLIQAGPCVVTQIRTPDKDGYTAVQLGYDDRAAAGKKLNKAQVGHLKASKAKSPYLHEIRLADAGELKVGDQVDVSQFQVGDKIKVSGTSKGKGFAGTIKRHNFNTGPKTHGSDSYRKPGSIGSMYPQKVMKGKKMAGRMGHATVSVANLEIAQVDKEQNLIAIVGAVPGPRKSIVIIKGEGKATPTEHTGTKQPAEVTP